MKLKWSIQQVYFYLICFVTLIMLIIGVTSIVNAAIDLAIPIPDGDLRQPYFENIFPKELQEKSTLPAEVIAEEVNQQKSFNDAQQKRNNLNYPLNRIFNGFAMILVAIPVYLYHWRKIPKLS